MHLLTTFGFRINLGQQGHTGNIKNENRKNEDRTERKQQVSQHKEIFEANSKNLNNVEHQNNVISTKYLITELHIEYEPVPLYRFSCDCKIWDSVTEICHSGRTRYVKNVLITDNEDTMLWIVFSIHHMTELNENQLRKFFNHKIKFRITGRGSSSKSKNDKVKQFQIRGESVTMEQDAFLELYPINLKEPEKESIPAAPVRVKDNQNTDFAIVSYIDPLPDIAHGSKFRNMLKSGYAPSQTIDIEQQDFKTESKTSRKKLRKTEQSKADKSKSSSKTYYEIVIEAEALFATMGTLTRYDDSPKIPGISNLLLYVQCDDVLPNQTLRTNFSPISINMEKLENFPCDILTECGFLYIYIKTTFVDQIIKTSHYNINECICFEFIKTFLCENFRPEQLISFLVTSVLIVEVIGIRYTNTRDSLSHDPQGLNKLVLKEEVLLGVAIFDLSELLRGSREVKSANSLYHPSVVYSANINDSTDAVSNEKIPISWEDSPLTYEILALSGTSIQLRVRLGGDLRPIYRRVLQSPDVLNRMLLILQDVWLARTLLEDVLLHNVTIRQAAECLNNSNDEFQLKPVCEDYITGFAIDCTDRLYILFEGLSKGYLSTVWESMSNLSSETGSVYYNSECFFLERLYDKFLSTNGILKVRLSGTLEKRLRDHDVYIGKSARTGQSEILRKLGLIKLTSTMRSLCQSYLLPDPEQLLSLEKETSKNSEDSLITNWMN